MKRAGWRQLQECPKYRILTRLVSWFRRRLTRQIENLKNIILVTRIFKGKADSAILLRFKCTINPQNLMRTVLATLRKLKFYMFFLCELLLNLKTEKKTGHICKQTLVLECEWDWSAGLSAVGRRTENLKLFLVSGITTAKWYSGTLGGPKVSWHLSYRWGKTPKKSRAGNLFRPGIEPGPAAWQARMLSLAPQRWTFFYIYFY